MKLNATKTQLCAALRAFINQRSGIEYGNYQSGDAKRTREAFNGDYRPMLKHGKQARELLRAVELRESITAENLVEATRAYSGRLQFVENGKGVAVDYTTGQYFPTEYRNAACAVLAACYRSKMPEPVGDKYDGLSAGDWIRCQARGEFSRAIATTWFR
jgi:hypothetical protein